MKVAMNELLGSLEGIRRSRVIRRRRTAQGHTGTPVEALTCPHIEHDGEKKAFQGRSTHVGTASAPAMCSLAILQVLHATTAHDWRGIDFLMRPRYCLIRALSQSSLIPCVLGDVTLTLLVLVVSAAALVVHWQGDTTDLIHALRRRKPSNMNEKGNLTNTWTFNILYLFL